MDAFAWAVVGSVAGVVAAAVVFGVIPLMQGRHKARSLPVEDVPRADVSGGQGVQAGSDNARIYQFIQNYIEQRLPAAPASGPVVVGDVPQRAPAFQPRAELMSRLGGSGSGSRWCER